MIEEGVKMSNEKVVIYGEIMPLPKVRGSLLPNTIASSGDDYLEIKSEIINARLGSDGEEFDSVGEHIRAINDKIGGQPNFIANEGEDGYILNRTHYVDKEGVVHKLDNKYIDADWMATSEEHIATAEVIPEQKVTSTWSNLQYLLQLGIIYDVYINGVVYPCTAWGSGAVILGNNTSLSKNDYPFCVYWAGGTATMGMFFYDENVFSSPIYLKVTEHSWTEYNKLPEEFLPESVDGVIVRSCTEGSSKKFKITVDDSGTISATEVTE